MYHECFKHQLIMLTSRSISSSCMSCLIKISIPKPCTDSWGGCRYWKSCQHSFAEFWTLFYFFLQGFYCLLEVVMSKPFSRPRCSYSVFSRQILRCFAPCYRVCLHLHVHSSSTAILHGSHVTFSMWFSIHNQRRNSGQHHNPLQTLPCIGGTATSPIIFYWILLKRWVFKSVTML